MTASMEMHGGGLTPRGLAAVGAWTRRTAVVGMGAAVIAALGTTPAAADHPSVSEEAWTSRAAAYSLSLAAGGEIAGSGGYIAINDGVTETVNGVSTPKLPVIDDQRLALVGVLGQDARASVTGHAAACAGVVGRGGTIKVGPDDNCLVSGDGTVHVSLGTLDQLGLSAILGGRLPGLPELPDVPDLPVPVPGLPEVPVPGIPDLPVPQLPRPDLPDVELPDVGTPAIPGLPDLDLPALPELALPAAGLPDVELAVVATAITARCLATPTETMGAADTVRARVVAIVDGQEIPLADVPRDGLALSLDRLLVTLQNHLPGEVSAIIDQLLLALPIEKLNNVQLANIQVGAQATVDGQITVTALGVEAAYPGLVDLALGTVTCGSNSPMGPLPPTKKLRAGPQTFAGTKAGDDKAQVKGGVDGRADQADTATTPGEATEGDATASADLEPASAGSPLIPVGWGLVLATILAAVGLALFKLRPRRTHS